MTAKPPSCSSIVLPNLAASALFIGAIIVRNFWLSVAFGSTGAIALTYAVLVMREARKGMTDEKKRKP